MYLRQSDATASLQLSSQRKRDLLDHFEARGDELDRWRRFNAAYHEDDLKFMRFLIPPGKRVLELGCGRGDLLAALQPSYGVGIDFGAAKQNQKIIETPDTLQGAHVRRDPDLPLSRRLAAVENGVVRLSQIEGDLSRHCEERSDEAIQLFRGDMDCFAEPVIGRAFARPVGSQ